MRSSEDLISVSILLPGTADDSLLTLVTALAVACRDIDVRHVRALIIGPPDTPYEFGFFEFSVKFAREYPTKAPSVTAITTNGGRTRFNPNIYAGGRVCL